MPLLLLPPIHPPKSMETFAKSMLLSSCESQRTHVPLVRSVRFVSYPPQNQSFWHKVSGYCQYIGIIDWLNPIHPCSLLQRSHIVREPSRLLQELKSNISTHIIHQRGESVDFEEVVRRDPRSVHIVREQIDSYRNSKATLSPL